VNLDVRVTTPAWMPGDSNVDIVSFIHGSDTTAEVRSALSLRCGTTTAPLMTGPDPLRGRTVVTKPELAAMRQTVIDGDVAGSRRLAQALVASDGDLLEAVERGFVAGIRRVGELWDEGEYFLPELVQGAEAMKAAMAVIQPALRSAEQKLETKGRVVIGTVEGDLHDIGKSLVAVLLSAHGFEVHDLGSSVPLARFLEKAEEVDANIVAASALLTTTMELQARLAEAVRARNDPRLKVLLGGAPTSQEWARKIGAAHAENALEAVKVATRLVG
jgi:methanogenic corrinoid protein MtbC1